jgi:hypothetical protein
MPRPIEPTKRYEVTVSKTVSTTIEVFAIDKMAAKKAVENYGITEAGNDYPRVGEWVREKINRITRVEIE